MVEEKYHRSIWILWLTVIGIGITFSLGMWQLDRADDKQLVHDMRMARERLPALQNTDLTCQSDRWLEHEQRHAILKGYWMSKHTVVLDNRYMAGRAGFVVLTPLLLEPSPMSFGCSQSAIGVLIQRGWLPRGIHDRTRVPEFSTPGGLVTVPVRLTFAPSKMLDLHAQSSIESGVLRQNVDMNALSLEWRLPLLPGSAQQLTSEVGAIATQAGTFEMQRYWWQPQADISKHHGYAVQWFFMSITILSLYAWFQWWKPYRIVKKEQDHE